MSTIIERFDSLKRYYNLSARGLADILGMRPATVINYCNGTQPPKLEFIDKLLATYPEVSAEWLVRGEGSMLRTEPVDLSAMKKKYETELLVKDGIIKELRSIILEKNQGKQSPERQQLVG